jgi:hypothetical protein
MEGTTLTDNLLISWGPFVVMIGVAVWAGVLKANHKNLEKDFEKHCVEDKQTHKELAASIDRKVAGVKTDVHDLKQEFGTFMKVLVEVQTKLDMVLKKLNEE